MRPLFGETYLTYMYTMYLFQTYSRHQTCSLDKQCITVLSDMVVQVSVFQRKAFITKIYIIVAHIIFINTNNNKET